MARLDEKGIVFIAILILGELWAISAYNQAQDTVNIVGSQQPRYMLLALPFIAGIIVYVIMLLLSPKIEGVTVESTPMAHVYLPVELELYAKDPTHYSSNYYDFIVNASKTYKGGKGGERIVSIHEIRQIYSNPRNLYVEENVMSQWEIYEYLVKNYEKACEMFGMTNLGVISHYDFVHQAYWVEARYKRGKSEWEQRFSLAEQNPEYAGEFLQNSSSASQQNVEVKK